MQYRNGGLILLSCFCLPLWAAPQSTTPGIENFHQISQNVYRGAQPTGEGFQYLSHMGVKVIIDLREHDRRSVEEERTVKGAGMRYVNVPMTGMTPPTAEQISTILALLENPATGPVFVHCKRGADRTGAVIAAYRIEHDSWENTRALSEAMADHMSRFQAQRQHYIRTFQARSTGSKPVDSAAAVAAPAVPSTENIRN